VDNVLGILRSLYDEYKLHAKSTSPIVSSSPIISGYGDDYFDDYNNFSGRRSRAQVGRSQLDLYLKEPALELNMELDILEFWHGSSIRYPELSLMAQDLLNIPITIGASESTFSLGGKIISQTRNALKPKTIQALVPLQDLRRADYDATLVVNNDSNSDDEGAYEDEEDNRSLFS